jgi:chemotaxis protein MotB
VLRFLVGHGVGASRLTAVGYADQHPIASNATAAGRTRNRRVEIVMRRIYGSSEP